MSLSYKVIFSGRCEAPVYKTREAAEKAVVSFLRERIYEWIQENMEDHTDAESYDECFDGYGELRENLSIEQLERLVEELNELYYCEASWEIREEK